MEASSNTTSVQHSVAATAASGGGAGGRSRTILWCVPRTVSTALSKCISSAQDNQVQVWFEPYFYCRITSLNLWNEHKLVVPPMYEGNEEVYRQAANLFNETFKCQANPQYLSYTSIKRFLEDSDTPHLFVKEIAHAVDKHHFKFIPEGFTHAFLIRHPLRVVSSNRKLLLTHFSTLGKAVDEQTFDIGRNDPYKDQTTEQYQEIYELWKYIRETSDRSPIVIDSDDLLAKPAVVLSKFCEAVGLPFDDSMLKWDASPEVVKKWAFCAEGFIEKLSYAFERAINSSEFLPPNDMPDRDQLTPDVIRCADEAMKYYNEMYEARLKI